MDAFLGIKSEKKSQRKEYNFTPSVNNLHDGKAANGYEPAPKKKGAWKTHSLEINLHARFIAFSSKNA